MPKTVIEIDVLDEKFKAFTDAFAQFQKALKESQKQLDDLGSASETAGDKGKKAFDSSRKALEEYKRSADAALPSLTKIGQVVASVALNAANAALSFAKWMAFGAIGSGFGLSALGAGAVGTQTAASGLGISSGSLRAARVAYGQMGLDVEGLLSKITQTKLDPSTGAAYNLFGIQGQRNMSATDIFAQMLRGGKNIDQTNPAVMNLLSQLGMTQQDINKIKAQSPSDIEAAIKKQKQLTPQYETSEKGWAGFMQALSEAGELIETSLIKNLSKLTPFLSELAKGLAGAIDKGLSTENFQSWIKEIGLGIQDFAKYLGSPEFRQTMKTLWYTFQDLIVGLQKFVNWVFHPLESAKKAFTQNPYDLEENQQAVVEKYAKAKEFASLPKGMLEAAIKYQVAQRPADFNTAYEMNQRTEQIAKTLVTELKRYGGQRDAQAKAYLATVVGEKNVDAASKAFKGDISQWGTTGLVTHSVQNMGGDFQLKITGDTSSIADIQLLSATSPFSYGQ